MPHHQHNPIDSDDVDIGRPPGVCEPNPVRDALRFLRWWMDHPLVFPKMENYDGPPLPDAVTMFPIKRKKEADDA